MMRCLRIACLPLIFALAACSASEPNTDDLTYDVDIRWTSYGIPHVKANDWGSLGYGFAYATATDAICVIARDVAMVNGELSKHIGPEDGSFESDVFHRLLLTPKRLQRFAAAQPEESLEFASGYVAGYNRYLADNRQALPQSCRDKPWVRPMVADDIARLNVGVGIRYGLGRFKNDIVRAAAPPASVAAGDTQFYRDAGLGSNGVAFGRAVTDTGRGVLLGNPHYPWQGSSRFHMIHTTIPGIVDAMGVSLYTTAAISIGFNSDIAWTHTVSTALRYTLFELSLNPDNPLEYRYGDGYRKMEVRDVEIEVLGTDDAIETRQHTVYSTHFGPLVVSEQLPWTMDSAFAIRDAVLDNTAGNATYAALSVAKTVDDIEAAISQQGVYWTNTIATDRHGTAFYADISSTPNVDAELLARCRVTPTGVPEFVIVLDGSRAECEWKHDARSQVAGTLPAEEMPRLRRNDYVTNSNDSYWLANPAEPLEGYSPIIGPEKTTRTLRTRAGLVFVEERLAANGKVSADDMREILYSHRNYGAELLLDDVLDVCTDDSNVALADHGTIDIAKSCEILTDWDRTATAESRGNHIWTEFWRNARNIGNVYRNPFDANDPVNTPKGVAVERPAVRLAVRQALAKAQKTLDDAGIALDARWGDIQYTSRNGDRIPVPGGQGWAGLFSMIVANLSETSGYTPILGGNSYIQVISWDKDGTLRPTGMLTYSQSQEPESPHNADMTALYARGEWLEFPFFEDDILADPTLKTLSLSETR